MAKVVTIPTPWPGFGKQVLQGLVVALVTSLVLRGAKGRFAPLVKAWESDAWGDVGGEE